MKIYYGHSQEQGWNRKDDPSTHHLPKYNNILFINVHRISDVSRRDALRPKGHHKLGTLIAQKSVEASNMRSFSLENRVLFCVEYLLVVFLQLSAGISLRHA